MKTKILRDSVHGYVSITEDDLKIIDTLVFQRLRRIRQSGCHTVYPSANHTRFEHSIGVMHLGVKVFDTIITKLSQEQLQELGDINTYKITVRYACLLHDVGHAPLSHTGEVFFDRNALKTQSETLTGVTLPKGSEHEYSSCIISIDIFDGILGEFGYDKELFCRMITGNPYPTPSNVNRIKNGIIEILNSSIDVDKLDYFSRDSFSSGTGNTLVSIDTERLIRAYNIVGGRLCFDRSALSVVANFVYARNTLYMWVYNHHVTIYTDYIFQEFLRKLLDKHPQNKDKYFSIAAIKNKLVDDTDIYNLFKLFKSLDPGLYEQLYGRKHYKCVWKNQFQLKELFFGADAQLDQFKETSLSVIHEELRQALGIEGTKLFVIKADFKFKKPKVFLNQDGTTRDFATIYQNNIYSSLFDTVPMVYIHPDINHEDVKNKIRELYI